MVQCTRCGEWENAWDLVDGWCMWCTLPENDPEHEVFPPVRGTKPS